MQKKQKKFNRVLHPNRHFVWAIVLLVLSAAALTAYLYIAGLSEDAGAVYPSMISRKLYVDHSQGYLAYYPQAWVLEKEASGDIIFENPSDSTESITVSLADLKFEKVIRASVDSKSEFDYQRQDYQVSIITPADSKDNGSELDVALVKTPTKLFYISGHSQHFTSFVHNFKPL